MNYIVKTKDVSVNNRKIVQNKFKNSYNIETSESKYKKLAQKLNLIKLSKLDINFFNIAIANGLNTFLIPFLVVMFSLINPKISAEIGIIQGSIIFILQIFSSNSRIILLNEKDDKNFENFVFFRLIVSSLIVIIYQLLVKDIQFIEENFHFNLILLILIFWINEITLVYIEKYNLNFFMKIYIFFLIIFYFFLIFLLFFNKNLLNTLFFIYFILSFLPSLYFFNLNLNFKIKYKFRYFY